MTAVGGAAASVQMEQLARDLYRMGEAGRRQLKARFREVAQPLLADARRRAGWSTRIPGAITVRAVTNDTRGTVGVQLRVSAAKAPHGRPYEGIAGGTEFRHPVYGNREVWRPQKTRPYALPAVVARGEDARRACVDAYEQAARDAGFR